MLKIKIIKKIEQERWRMGEIINLVFKVRKCKENISIKK